MNLCPPQRRLLQESPGGSALAARGCRAAEALRRRLKRKRLRGLLRAASQARLPPLASLEAYLEVEVRKRSRSLLQPLPLPLLQTEVVKAEQRIENQMEVQA